MSRPAITSIRPENSGPRSLTTILRWFHAPDDVREFTKGRVEVVTIAGKTLARATYEPGWKWSEHVGPIVGAKHCTTEHLGFVVSGHATAAFDDGRVYDLIPGTDFYIPVEPLDSWVIGDAPHVPLHIVGAEHLAVKA